MIAIAILNRLVMALVTLFGVALIVFVLLRVVPGDPIAMMISPGATPADIAAMRAHYGLDASLPVQFGLWLKAVAIGDFGTSISLKRSVLGLLGDRLPATLELAFAALVLAVLLGGLVAIVGTLVRRTILEPIIDSLNGLFLAVPDFVWALALVLVFGVAFPLFPLSGRIDPSIDAQFHTPFYLIESLVTLRFDIFADVAAHMVMPVLALGLPLAAIVARVLKATLSEAMLQDYILLARLKGMSNLRLVLQEALRNAVGPTIALTGVQFTFLIGGTVIVERIFAYPGIGNMAIDAVINRDLPLIQGLVLVFGLLFIVINLMVDALVAAFNPRLAHG
ncbi:MULTISPECIES: ABC transporter permease [Rhizobium]|uniref:ABC transporter permease n=1 Tax=Rhizobium rhododendri TaxID=2506430 RepID=A0ABY8IDR9_9HYPH|nr:MULTISPECIES: ABC transporter permease [Rhizobium]MBZ5758952.1 ABC transporter permease [Rhizobium sp. VS19-DR96]MBZ5764218.1 ABC transporter permease [Rhizobium sp. VS19-DR129.2]MBZ5771761.1 ABC transporter permease [Rhizobium sp. VS19-DRK62.2]MBZ5783552.1 ABC transporter permease [Rhizobium sp. VS19-DR121]MBZ5801774.1 ABC transporter permease [Rhizobium sp. VS19-DR181]